MSKKYIDELTQKKKKNASNAEDTRSSSSSEYSKRRDRINAFVEENGTAGVQLPQRIALYPIGRSAHKTLHLETAQRHMENTALRPTWLVLCLRITEGHHPPSWETRGYTRTMIHTWTL